MNLAPTGRKSNTHNPISNLRLKTDHTGMSRRPRKDFALVCVIRIERGMQQKTNAEHVSNPGGKQINLISEFHCLGCGVGLSLLYGRDSVQTFKTEVVGASDSHPVSVPFLVS